MPCNATLVDVCLLDDRTKTLQAPLVSSSVAAWKRTKNILSLRAVIKASREGGDGGGEGPPPGIETLPGFRSEVGRLLGHDDRTWILESQVGRAPLSNVKQFAFAHPSLLQLHNTPPRSPVFP